VRHRIASTNIPEALLEAVDKAARARVVPSPELHTREVGGSKPPASIRTFLAQGNVTRELVADRRVTRIAWRLLALVEHTSVYVRSRQVIVLGVILLIVALLVPSLSILWTIGVILIVVGVILEILSLMGRAVGGRRHYY